MSLFILTWVVTSIAAYTALFITERRTAKGFPKDEAKTGFALCFFIPYMFFIIFGIGLTMVLLDKKRRAAVPKKPTITPEDVALFQRSKRQARDKVDL